MGLNITVHGSEQLRLTYGESFMGKKIKKMLNKIYDFIIIAFIAVILIVMFCAGVFHILAYGIPLGIYKKDMYQVLNGIGMIGLVFLVLLGIKLIYMFFEYLDRRQGNFSKEINPKKWPYPKMRTVNKTLIYMTRRVYLLVWDLLIGIFIFSALLAKVCMIMDNKEPMDFGSILWLPIVFFIIWLPVRIGIVIFYYYRKYAKKMLYYSKKYVGIRDSESFLKKLEKSLKEDLLYYSHEWIITKDYFMAYCETRDLFHPIAIPVNEMLYLQYEVRTREVHTRHSRVTVDEAVIICKLRSGKSVDLYVGGRGKIGTIWKVLEYFKIPYENKMNPNEHYEEPYEITVTVPVSGESGNVVANNTTSSIGGSSNLSGLEAVIMKMDARDVEKVYQLLESGQKVTAIKEIREMTGVGLAEAKKIADDYQIFRYCLHLRSKQ